MTTILEGCGCFTDTELNVFWPCSLHRGVTEEERRTLQVREQEDLTIEADAWLKWAK